MADGFQSSDSDDEIGHYNNQDKNNNDDDEINETSNAQIEKELQRCGSLDLDMDKEESNKPGYGDGDIVGRIKRSSSILTDGDMLIKMFNRNEKGFVKNKEMKINIKSNIFGLNAPVKDQGAAGKFTPEESALNKGPSYDILYGEQLVKTIKNIWCQHNFNTTYLKNTTNASSKNQDYTKSLKTFQNMCGNLVITNYRIVFVVSSTQKDKYFEQMMRGQPNIVYDFFNIPIAYIGKIDKQLNLALETKNQNKYNYNNNQRDSQNQIDLYTKDNRHLRFIFGAMDNYQCTETHTLLEKAAFLDVNGSISPSNLFNHAFAFTYKIDVNDQNWVNYVDGWSLFLDIRSEIQRQGVDLRRSEQFRLFSNEKFDLCRTYPSFIVVPRAVGDS